ncbi:hypothetical protein RRG08_005445 [Elysia crispata]|uniref:Uncharacterized protein n=1 Tax=Elysia crispata TaxID=231223 RepID=A0AAE0Y1C0_9GAST|nr:hypothetical protein RRG08_005445 [Elysia crispata]
MGQLELSDPLRYQSSALTSKLKPGMEQLELSDPLRYQSSALTSNGSHSKHSPSPALCVESLRELLWRDKDHGLMTLATGRARSGSDRLCLRLASRQGRQG